MEEERDSLILTVKMLSRDLYNNSNQACPPSNLSPANSPCEVPDANPSGNNNNGRSEVNHAAPVASLIEARRSGQFKPRKNRNKSKK